MTTSTPAPRSLRELARRATGGVEVALFWEPTTDELTVCVADETLDSYFELHPSPEDALDCFYHPYSYASPEPDLLAA